MASWEQEATLSEDVFARLVNAIQPFSRTTVREGFLLRGVTGSAEFPMVLYGNSFVYAIVSAATLCSDISSGCGAVRAAASSDIGGFIQELQVPDSGLPLLSNSLTDVALPIQVPNFDAGEVP
jgi:hypothetical protein